MKDAVDFLTRKFKEKQKTVTDKTDSHELAEINGFAIKR